MFLLLVASICLGLLYYFNRSTGKGGDEDNPVVIVPHFDLFKEKRQELFQKLAKQYRPKRIILFSVNHYGAGNNKLLTTDRSWDFKDQKITLDRETFSRLSELDFVTVQEGPFVFEHGIKNVLPDLVRYFPEAEVATVMIRDDIKQDELQKIFDQVFACAPESMPVFSVDFSHYNPSSMAKIHDAYSIGALKNLDTDSAFLAETDSPQLMDIALRWAQKTKNKHFNLFYNGDSGEISGNLEMETTSVVLGHYSRGAKQDEKNSTFIFAGDAMFDRLVYETFKDKKPEEVMSKIGNRFFAGVDLSVLNLEGPISSETVKADTGRDDLVFNFPPQTIDILNYLKINTVSLANNHTNNAGREGYEETARKLSEAKIGSVGSYDNKPEYLMRRMEGVGQPISIIAVNDLVDANGVAEVIKRENTSGRLVFVFAHWGAEYSKTRNGKQEEAAKIWQKNGADFIAGSHPHIIEDLEITDGTPIIYSLGNFIFDQNFSRETNEGLIVGGVINENEIKLSFFPVKIINQAPELMRGQRRQEILDKLLGGDSGFTRISGDTILINKK